MQIRTAKRPAHALVLRKVLSSSLLAALVITGTDTARAGTPGWYTQYIVSGGTSCTSGGPGGAYAGSCETGDVSHATVDYPADTAPDANAKAVAGGISIDGSADDNTVTIKGPVTGLESVYGGLARSNGSHADGNVVTITGSTVQGDIHGGRGNEAGDNVVTLRNAIVKGRIRGGEGNTSSGNVVKVTDSTVDGEVTAGEGSMGSANNNRTAIIDSTLRDEVNGAWSDSGDVTGNNVVVKGSKIGTDVTGGDTMDGKSADNSITVNSSTVNGTVLGGWSDVSVSGNTVTITDSTVKDGVNGGAGGTSSGNTVTITGSTINVGVMGGSAWADEGHTAQANGNTVTLTDTRVTGFLAAGASTRGDATGNTLILHGGNTLTDATLYGGYAPHGESRGNKLVVYGKGIHAQNVHGFQIYHFLLPADMRGGDTVLSLNPAHQFDPGKASESDLPSLPLYTDMRDAKVGVAVQSGDRIAFRPGDRVALVRNPEGVKTAGITETELTGYQGISLAYDFTLENDNGKNLDNDKNNKTLWAVLDGTAHKPVDDNATGQTDNTGSDALPVPQMDHDSPIHLQDQTKAPVEGRLGMLALLRNGATLTTQGMTAALEATDADTTEAFVTVGGSHARIDSGSEMRVNGGNILVGVAHRTTSAASTTTVGGFIEAGKGHYDTRNTFDDIGRVHGSGDSRYYGAGMLVHHAWSVDGRHGPYVRGSLHAGHIRGDWHSRDMFNSHGRVAWQTSGAYYAAQAGIGYRWKLGDTLALDVHDDYYWTHVESDEDTLAGDRFDFHDMDSQLNRLGAKLTKRVGAGLNVYAAATWEHEFDGDARASIYGMRTAAPSLGGDTGIVTLGLSTNADATSPWRLDAALSGYTGVRRGAGLRVRANYLF